MRTRMQPINNIWAKFPRVVRDLSVSCGKQVRVEMEGKETELDKSLIEAMKDPLTHLIRNAIDHGVELPAIRRADGKPEEGRLSMRAYHEGGQVHIEIGDDGAGINPGKLRNKALEKGLITAERALTMTDQDIRRLIFRRGSPPPKRSPTSPGAASAWTWSRPTSKKSAASSTWKASSGRAPPSRSASR